MNQPNDVNNFTEFGITENEPVRLVLSDGTSYEGYRLGASGDAYGEVVFNTSMTGYQEMLTDPSYRGQILIPTYPLIGNYGVNRSDVESNTIQVNGFVVRNACGSPSHSLSEGTIDEYLESGGVVGISGIDTRSLTRHLRSQGVMMGVITSKNIDEALSILDQAPQYGEFDVVHSVSTPKIYEWDDDEGESVIAFKELKSRSMEFLDVPGGWGDKDRSIEKRQFEKKQKIVIGDYGVKLNILRSLRARNCLVEVVPDDASAEQILELQPDGVLLSPGPGDPIFLEAAVETAKKLVKTIPVMGICLGHQVIARSFGASTFKLHFGHRGGNQPVKDLQSGKVYVTAQNHGYAVDPKKLPEELEISHINLNDNTIEGLVHKSLPVMTIQYHSEASPGPHDSEYLFDRFIEMVRNFILERNPGGKI